MKKPTVTFVSGHACIRCQKEALPLINKDYDIHHISGNIPSFVEYYKTFTTCAGINHYADSIKLYDRITDIWHVQNEPSWFVTLIKELSDKPIVCDVHDTDLTRVTEEEVEESRKKTRHDEGGNLHRVSVEERNNFQLADGLVFVSEAVEKITKDTFKLDQPSIVLPHFVPKILYEYNSKEWLGGLVYEGRVDLKEKINKKPSMAGFRYCDYEEFATKCKELDMDFHLYSMRTHEEFMKVYENIAFVHEGYPYKQLLRMISRHDWGLVGNLGWTPQWHYTAANKLFDYVAAAVPVVAMNADGCAQLIKEYDLGIVVESVEELRDRWKEHREKRKSLIKNRQGVAMETHIHKLEDLYKEMTA